MVSKEIHSEILELLHKMRQTELTDKEWDQLLALCAEDRFFMDAIDGLRLLSPKERFTRISSIEKSLEDLLGINRKKKTLVTQLKRVAAVILLCLGFWVIWQAFPEQNGTLVMRESEEAQEHGAESNAAETAEKELGQSQIHPLVSNQVKHEPEHEPDVESAESVNVEGGQNESEIVESMEKENEIATTSITSLQKDQYQNKLSVQDQTYSATGSLTSKAVEREQNDPSTPSVQRSPDPTHLENLDAGSKRSAATKSEIETPAPGIKSDEAQLLNELVVSNKKDMQKEKNQAPAQISYALAMPLMGWKSYYKYIRKNIQTPTAAGEASISGTVMLEFDLKRDGSPHNFRIVQSLGYGCDEEAIRLVREGPKWDVKNAQVEIGGLSVDF